MTPCLSQLWTSQLHIVPRGKESYLYVFIIADLILMTNGIFLNRSKFVAVKEDQMLLGSGVIAATTFIIKQNSWKEVLKNIDQEYGKN